MNTTNEMDALFGAIDSNAESTGKGGPGARRCAVIAETDTRLAVAVVLPPSQCAMETRGRIRVALRALPQFPAKGALWALGSVAAWDTIPETMRDTYAAMIPPHDECDSVYLVTATRKA